MKILICLLIIGFTLFFKPTPHQPIKPLVVKTEIKKTEKTPEFEKLSDSELTEYNQLVWKRAEVIKNRIFKKYYNKYGKAAI